MIRILTAALVLALFHSGAVAQDIGGRYRVSGTNLDGSKYTGTATVTLQSDVTCTIRWNTGGDGADGVCMRDKGVFVAGYVMGDSVGLVVYDILPDGTLTGRWTVTGQSGIGTEVLSPN
ncbi:hypothetical protein [Microbaculum marinum]|uniref:Uncharacterized protein n=1 Tax=Microbaculum marinum TaxID=1764581 RepID=A0AAW9RN16_9HYPH